MRANSARPATKSTLRDVELAPRVVRLLARHSGVSRVALVGSRAEGRATPRSDYDFIVKTTDFAGVSGSLPALLAPLEPLSQQWDRLSDTMCWMVMLCGPVKVDMIFPGPPHEREPPWEPAPETLDGMEAHFWDWILWLRSKEEKHEAELVDCELRRLHGHLLAPLSDRQPPSSITEAVERYRMLRDEAERRFGCTVFRNLEAAVLPAVRAP